MIAALFRAGMHSIRPAGQMWPAKAFKLALKALIYIHVQVETQEIG